MTQSTRITLEDIFVTEKYKPQTYTDVKTINDPLQIRISAILQSKGWDITIANYHIHPKNENLILVSYDQKSIYRRSFYVKTLLLDLQNEDIITIEDSQIRLVAFSPDGNYISYIKSNNLYVYNLDNKDCKAITADGLYNHIINGHTDWAYEEEFGFTKAYHWNADSTKIAYLRFDESLVKEYDMTIYSENYNQNYSYKYPKAGERNAVVSVHIYDLHSQTNIEISSSLAFEYIPKLMWVNDQILVFTLNRLQNKLCIYLQDFKLGTLKLIYEEKEERYIDFYADSYIIDGDKLLFYSDLSGYKNLHSLDLVNFQATQITNFQFDISDTIFIDLENKYIYASAGYPTPMDRNIIAINYQTNIIHRLTEETGYHELFMDKQLDNCVLQYSNLNSLPQAWNCKILLDDNFLPYLNKEKIIIDNERLESELNPLNLPISDLITIENKDHVAINGWLLKPTNFSESNSYPLLVCNYGGPGSQMVLNKYGMVNYWHKFMAEKGFIVACFDNTGTGSRGADFRKATYKKLGQLEIQDQIDIAQHFSNYNYIDNSKIIHWGWSFGGFMSLLAITKGANIFTHSIAIAPVTDWRWYDSIYTERYMQTPETNQIGYEENRPFHYSDKMRGKLLLIHGSADDNVHIQHSLLFSEELIQKDKAFDMFIYPNKNHRITGGNTTLHLWKKITAWLEQL
ncbi:S9 family peptidase [Rhizosphaericola mali]|uniref:Prolyl oligopeptidase family serine peptidase n=1 Tax=Rhizosphaericola mali TaxID=2545455 RepID=A0A5P2FZJ2_9BACT|nr:DPP IV N-terminal domain-containing protein [Rhizosphaericola mali]QES87249.1 prolyl oligopeptidase family serine peptidase [Rhizosphaericola mali]